MLTTEQISDLIIRGIEHLQLPERPSGLYRPIRYALSCGGKRLRPALLLHAMQACGGDPARALNQALGIEMFHNFTLVHDDVMDNADVRRGQLTVHRRWNADTAILSGDAMLTRATQLMTEGCPADRLAGVIDRFNATAMLVYEGQQLDMDFEDRLDVDIDEYITMISRKTAALLSGACCIGAYMGGADEAKLRAFAEYAENLGLAFQLRDDWLDTYGDPVCFGKEIGGDIVNEKKTWLLITALTESRDAVVDIFNRRLDPADKVAAVLEVYNKLNLNERALTVINHFADKAVAAISRLDINDDDRRYFLDLAEQSASRVN